MGTSSCCKLFQVNSSECNLSTHFLQVKLKAAKTATLATKRRQKSTQNTHARLSGLEWE